MVCIESPKEGNMTPQKQTIFSDVDKGIHGNCFTACVASLFDKSISEVPNFIEFDDWFVTFWNYITSLGATFGGCRYTASHSWPSEDEWDLFDGYLIAGGGSPRGVPGGHAVIYRNGEPFFDPHPSNDFLTTVEEFYLIGKPQAPSS